MFQYTKEPLFDLILSLGNSVTRFVFFKLSTCTCRTVSVLFSFMHCRNMFTQTLCPSGSESTIWTPKAGHHVFASDVF